MASVAQQERAGVCSALEQIGPEGPTLCEGWQTRDLAVHLVVRERRPDAAAGLVVPAFAGHLRQVSERVSARPYDELIAMIRSGPPAYSPMRLLDSQVNTLEYFVHHEDIRRAQPEWTVRADDAAREAALWSRVSMMARLALRKAPVGVRLAPTTAENTVVHRGGSMVTISGPPTELALYLTGRRAHAQVALDGSEQAVQLLHETPLGI